jgi:hypothetical protein
MSKQANAAKELLRRRRARKNLVDFARYTKYGYIPADHHHLICEKLEAVERGEIKRLMIEMPPRHGKSELASRRFPAWFLGRNPEKSIIAASYNSDLASDFGREVRNIVKEQAFSNLYDVTLASDSSAAGRWHTNKGGSYVSAGVGTSVTGRGAHILLIDDPFKDRAEADSETIRDKVYNWYLSTAYTRLEGDIVERDHDALWNDVREAKSKGERFEGAIVVINTRWHEDDLSGRLLRDMENGADQFERLALPAINDAGEALWPAKYPIKRLNEIKATLTRVSNREWNSLYQQNPTAEEGGFFRREWFPRFSLGEEPETTNYQAGDFAVTGGGGDYTDLGVFGMDADKHLWVKDWWFGQASADIWVDAQLEQYANSKCFASFGESGVIRKAVEPLQRLLMAKRNIYPRWEWIARTHDKATCARAFQGMAAQGMVHIPYTDWGNRLIDQLCKFPAGTYDDAVDVCGTMGMAIADAHPAIINPRTPKKEKLDTWGRPVRTKSNWQTS